MSEADRERWNSRYQAEAYDFTPADWLRALEPRLRNHPAGARALDLACGGGRNALYLAELGYVVDAWDISDIGLDFLRRELQRRGGAGEPVAVEPRRVDLERVALAPERFHLLHRNEIGEEGELAATFKDLEIVELTEDTRAEEAHVVARRP